MNERGNRRNEEDMETGGKGCVVALVGVNGCACVFQ